MSEPNVRHQEPHFHAYYQDSAGVFTIAPVDIAAGSLPTRQLRLVEAWAEMHQDELLADWEKLRDGSIPDPIKPLS